MIYLRALLFGMGVGAIAYVTLMSWIDPISVGPLTMAVLAVAAFMGAKAGE